MDRRTERDNRPYKRQVKKASLSQYRLTFPNATLTCQTYRREQSTGQTEVQEYAHTSWQSAGIANRGTRARGQMDKHIQPYAHSKPEKQIDVHSNATSNTIGRPSPERGIFPLEGGGVANVPLNPIPPIE